ncbi:MAG: 4Fe-4S binding protein [Verrucomicrobiales bacterium]|nr:4Fe-4S binding protein [Verrucomicrobiales bacterium]
MAALLQIYRLGVLIAIAWLIREHHLRLRVQGDRPIVVAEVRVFLPAAHRLVADPGPRSGLVVEDAAGLRIGYAARTMPQSREITGYSGPTDALIVFDADDRVLGVAFRHSYDTPSHVEDVRKDFLFMENWNGRTWDEIAAIQSLADANIYAVSGATRTSECLAHSIGHRLRSAEGTSAPPSTTTLVLRWQDGVLALIVALGCVFAFLKKPAVQRWRPWFHFAVFLTLGFVLGDLLAQSLLIGWAESGIPWRTTPGVVLLAAAAFLIPWTTKQPLYCTYLCPHGHAQRWLMKVVPARWTLKPHDAAKPLLRILPVLLLAIVLLTSFLSLPLDLAGIEPFDAYLIRSAGTATLAVAVAGLLLSLVLPMAYCKYGCPTGLLLAFVRRHAGESRPGLRDGVALVFLAAAIALYQWHDPIVTWLASVG